MSVINQMLKDLEQRQQGELPAAPVLSASLPARNRKLVWILCLALFGCLALAGVTYYLSTQWQLIPKAEQAQTATPSVANAAVAAEKPVLRSEQQPSKPPAPQVVATPSNTQAEPVTQAITPAAATPRVPEPQPKAPVSVAATTCDVITHSQPVAESKPQPVRNRAPVAQPNQPSAGQRVAVAQADTLKQPPAKPASEMKITPVQLSAKELAEVKHRKAKQAFSRQQVEQGIKLLAQVVELDPARDNARIELAGHYYSGRRLGDAVKVLEQGVVRQSDNTQFRRMLARIFIEREQLQQAFSYTRMLPSGPSLDVEYLSIRAGLAQRLERYDDAHDSYRALAEYQPDQAKWWLGLAMASDRLEQTNVAYEAYRRAMSEAGLSDASRRYAEQRIRQLEMR